MSAPKPKTDSPFAARASTRAPFPAASSTGGSNQPPSPAPERSPGKKGPPWPLLIGALLLAGGGLATWLATRSPSSDASQDGPPPVSPVMTQSTPAPISTPPPATVNAAQTQELKENYEKLAAIASSLELNAQEKAAFASTTLAAAQADRRLAAGEFADSAPRWREAAQNLGQIIGPRLRAVYETEAGAFKGLNLADYTGPAVKALSAALSESEAAGNNREWTAASLKLQEARELIGKAQAEIATQLGEVAKDAATRGEMDLATYFYERTLRLDPDQRDARTHLYLHKFKPGETIRTSTGIELAYIPPGTFTRGSPLREPGRSNDEIQRPVKLTKGFYIGIKEITQREWDAVYGEGAAARTLLASRTVSESKSREDLIGLDLPMHSVRWQDAVDFCLRLSAIEKRTFRLPTEAEWEYACRAGTTSAFNNGSDGLSARDANVDDGSTEARYALTQAGTANRANRYGLRDMHGNVWEWCADWSAPYPPGKETIIDPSGPSDSDAGRLDVAMKVIRGGGYNASASDARSANRSENSPAIGLGYIGLRVVQEAVLITP